jgi:hypothetical protein
MSSVSGSLSLFWRVVSILAVAMTVACNGGGGSGGGNSDAGTGGSATTSHTVGGAVTGLAGSGLALRNNGGDNIAPGNGPFTFPSALPNGTAYSVAVATQPTNPTQLCTVVANPSGIINSANVTNVQVSCTTRTYAVSGTVTGLSGSGLALQNNGGDNLPVSANGSFSFATAVTDGSNYNVTVLTQPSSPAQTCSAGATGAGTIAGADITSVLITCTRWTKQIGTSVYDAARGIATDGAGNIYVVGETDGAFDGNTSGGGTDIAVIKYDVNGTKIWSRQLGTAGNDIVHHVAVGTGGNIYIAGQTTGAFAGHLNAGGNDAFLAKYDAAGTLLWTRQFGTALYDAANGITVAATGEVYLAGETDGALPGQVSAGDSDVFVAKYDAAGTLLWTRQFGTALYDAANGITVAATGEVYLAGETDGALPGQVSAGSTDIFTAKYDTNGALGWLGQLGSAQYDAATGVALGSDGNIYAAGETHGALDGYTSSGMADMVVIKFNAAGVRQ